MILEGLSDDKGKGVIKEWPLAVGLQVRFRIFMFNNI